MFKILLEFFFFPPHLLPIKTFINFIFLYQYTFVSRLFLLITFHILLSLFFIYKSIFLSVYSLPTRLLSSFFSINTQMFSFSFFFSYSIYKKHLSWISLFVSLVDCYSRVFTHSVPLFIAYIQHFILKSTQVSFPSLSYTSLGLGRVSGLSEGGRDWGSVAGCRWSMVGWCVKAGGRCCRWGDKRGRGRGEERRRLTKPKSITEVFQHRSFTSADKGYMFFLTLRFFLDQLNGLPV